MLNFKCMINVIQSDECYVDDISEITFIIHLKFNIYFYICRDVRSITCSYISSLVRVLISFVLVTFLIVFFDGTSIYRPRNI